MRSRTTRALVVTMAAGVLMSTAPAAMAQDYVEGPPITITPPDPRHEQKYPSEGVVSASISEPDQARLREAGYNVVVTPVQDSVEIEWSADEVRARDLSGLTDMGTEESDRLRVELGVLAMNIHERDKQSPYPTSRAGEDSAFQTLAHATTYRPGFRAVGGASVSSWRAGGVNAITEISTTTDAYREYNADRQAKVESAGRRGHYLPNLSECYAKIDVCGFFVTPVVTGSDPDASAGMVTRARTDSIWVSVGTRAGLPEPMDYVDAGGHEHLFTLNTAETHLPQDRLSTAWRNAPGRDEQNRVLPQFELDRAWDHEDGVVRLGLRTSIPVNHRLERVADTDEYVLTVSAVEALDGRVWNLRLDGLEGQVFAQDDEGRTVVSDVKVISYEGQDVVLSVTVSTDDPTLTPVPAVTSQTISAFSGGRVAAQSLWQQPTYDEEIVEAQLPDPEYVEPPVSGPRPPRDSSNIPLTCSGGWLAVVIPPGAQAGFIDPAGTYYPDLTMVDVRARIAEMTEEERGCPVVQPEPPVEEPQPEPPVVDVPESPEPPVEQPQPPVVDVPEAPEPEAPVASPKPPVVSVDQPRLDPSPQPEAEPEVVATPAPVAEDKPAFLQPLRPETGVDGIGSHATTATSASPSLLSLLIAAATAVGAVLLYGGSRPVRLGRRYVARHASD